MPVPAAAGLKGNAGGSNGYRRELKMRGNPREKTGRHVRPGRRGTVGFTLVEILVVVGIVSVLSALALPNLTKVAHRSRRVEAYNILKGIYVAQAEYFVSTGMFADTFDVLGFDVSGGNRLDARSIQAPHYTYTINALTQDGVPGANFRATATGDIDPTDPVLDILIIENEITIVQ